MRAGERAGLCSLDGERFLRPRAIVCGPHLSRAQQLVSARRRPARQATDARRHSFGAGCDDATRLSAGRHHAAGANLAQDMRPYMWLSALEVRFRIYCVWRVLAIVSLCELEKRGPLRPSFGCRRLRLTCAPLPAAFRPARQASAGRSHPGDSRQLARLPGAGRCASWQPNCEGAPPITV